MVKIRKRKKANYLKYIFDRRLISLFFIFFLLVLTFLTASYSQSNQSNKITNLQTKAAAAGCQCSDLSHCYPDMCSRNPNKLASVCSDFPNDGPHPGTIDPYFCTTSPDCCTDLANQHDAYKCCWIERGFCRPDQCQQITGNKGKCGWYWSFHYTDDPNGIGTNTKNGYGCMIGDSEATMRPKYGPTAGTTNTPVLPSQTPAITNTPIPSNSITPTNTPSSTTPTGTVTPLSPTITSQVTMTQTPTLTPRPTATPTVTPYPLISPMLPKTPPNSYPSPPYCI